MNLVYTYYVVTPKAQTRVLESPYINLNSKQWVGSTKSGKDLQTIKCMTLQKAFPVSGFFLCWGLEVSHTATTAKSHILCQTPEKYYFFESKYVTMLFDWPKLCSITIIIQQLMLNQCSLSASCTKSHHTTWCPYYPSPMLCTQWVTFKQYPFILLRPSYTTKIFTIFPKNCCENRYI